MNDNDESAAPVAAPGSWETAALLKDRTRQAIRERVQAGDAASDVAHEYGVPLAFVEHLIAWQMFGDDQEAAEIAPQPLQREIHEFVEHCRDIRNGSPNAFYAFVDAFCKRHETAAWSAETPHPPPLFDPFLQPKRIARLGAYLDTLTITGETIGDVRRILLFPWDDPWNGIVREETAKRERPSAGVVPPPASQPEPEHEDWARSTGAPPASPPDEPYKDVLTEVYGKAADYWAAQCFCFTSAPESLRRNAHESAREGFNVLRTLLGPIVRPWLNAEYREAVAAAKAEAPPASPPPAESQSTEDRLRRYAAHHIATCVKTGECDRHALFVPVWRFDQEVATSAQLTEQCDTLKADLLEAQSDFQHFAEIQAATDQRAEVAERRLAQFQLKAAAFETWLSIPVGGDWAEAVSASIDRAFANGKATEASRQDSALAQLREGLKLFELELRHDKMSSWGYAEKLKALLAASDGTAP